MNEGAIFVEPDHPVCAKCISSLDREDSCIECGGEGIVEDDMDYVEAVPVGHGFVTCPECLGVPSGWYCPTCKRHWAYSEIQFEEENAE